jgi:voltage-gated potassium channel
VTPYATAGRVMASLMVRPQVSAFVNVLTSAEETGLNVEEIELAESCDAVGKTIGELDVQTRTGAYIVAIRKGAGHFGLRPSKDARLDAGDVIVGLGSPEEVARLEQLFQPREALAHRD